MNPDSPQTPREELEARLTALLLGELSTDEAAAVRRALAQDAELAKLHDRLQATIGLVRETVTTQTERAAEQLPLKLSDERREKLLAHFKTVPLLPKLANAQQAKRSWLIPMSVAAALVALLGVAALLLNPPRMMLGVGSDFSEDDYGHKRPDAITPLPNGARARRAAVESAPQAQSTQPEVVTLNSGKSADASAMGNIHSLDVVGYHNVGLPQPGAVPSVPAAGLPASTPVAVASASAASPPPSAPRPTSPIVLPPVMDSADGTELAKTQSGIPNPEWAGVLEQFGSAASSGNRFLGRYAYDAKPTGGDALAAAKSESWYFDEGIADKSDFSGRATSQTTTLWDESAVTRGFFSETSTRDSVVVAQSADHLGRTDPWDHSHKLLDFWDHTYGVDEGRGQDTARGRGEVTIAGQPASQPRVRYEDFSDAAVKSAGDAFYGGYGMLRPSEVTAQGVPESARGGIATATTSGWTDKMHQKQGGMALADGRVQKSSVAQLSEGLRQSADNTPVLGDTPELGRQFYRLSDTGGGGGARGGGGQTQSAPAVVPPETPPAPIQAGSAVTLAKGVELEPLPLQLPAPSLKGMLEDLPKGPNIEPLGTKPAGTVVLGQPEAAQEAGTSEQRAAFRRRYGSLPSNEKLAEIAARKPAPVPAAPAVQPTATLDFGVAAIKSSAPAETKETETVAGRGITPLGSTKAGDNSTISAGNMVLSRDAAVSDQKKVAEVRERYLADSGGIAAGGRIAPEENVRSMDVDALTVTTATPKDAVGVVVEDAACGQQSSIILPQIETTATGREAPKTEELARVKTTPARPSREPSPSKAAQLVQDGKLLFELGKLDEAEARLTQAKEAAPDNNAASYYMDLVENARRSQEARKRDVNTGHSPVQVALARQRDVTNPENRSPDFEKKRAFENAQALRTTPEVRLAAEKADAGIPKTTMVDIVDRAVTAHRKTGGLAASFGGSYASTARVKTDRDVSDIRGLAEPSQSPGYDPYFIQTEFEVIQSERILSNVVQELNLQEQWGEKYAGGTKLKQQEALSLLREKLNLKPVRGTSLIEIRAKSEDPQEAANIANAVAETYQDYRSNQRRQLATGGVPVLEKRFQEHAEVDRLQKELTDANHTATVSTRTIEVDAPPVRKPPTNAPIPQPEVQTSDNAFSTFSLKVSDVAFKLAAASLEKGQMPDAASVRAEEFINAFDYRDPEPQWDSASSLSAQTGKMPVPLPGPPIAFAWERARYPFAHNRDLLRFSVKTAAAGRQAGRPLNLVLLLDNSGSMERADRVQIIREALRVLAGQLQPQDKLSVITFASTPRLWVDGVAGDKSGEVLDQISGLTPQGGTNLEEAMNLAYATALRHYLAGGINRVVLLTDGAANLGNVEPESLKQKVESHRRQGIAFDCFGIGWEGFNDDLLEVLSRNGDGRYGFINSPEEAATEFAGQLAGALKVAASDVKVQVEFNPKRVTAYRQIGYAKHQLTKEQFRDNTVDAAEIAAQEAGNALYTVEVNPAGEGPLCTVRCRFKIPGTTDYREHEWVVPHTGNAVSLEQASPTMRLAATASAFAEWLVVSPFAAEVTPDVLLAYLSGVPEVYGADARPKKLEWMIRQAKSIGGK